jgi:hypothetical protein
VSNGFYKVGRDGHNTVSPSQETIIRSRNYFAGFLILWMSDVHVTMAWLSGTCKTNIDRDGLSELAFSNGLHSITTKWLHAPFVSPPEHNSAILDRESGEANCPQKSNSILIEVYY